MSALAGAAQFELHGSADGEWTVVYELDGGGLTDELYDGASTSVMSRPYLLLETRAYETGEGGRYWLPGRELRRRPRHRLCGSSL